MGAATHYEGLEGLDSWWLRLNPQRSMLESNNVISQICELDSRSFTESLYGYTKTPNASYRHRIFLLCCDEVDLISP